MASIHLGYSWKEDHRPSDPSCATCSRGRSGEGQRAIVVLNLVDEKPYRVTHVSGEEKNLRRLPALAVQKFSADVKDLGAFDSRMLIVLETKEGPVPPHEIEKQRLRIPQKDVREAREAFRRSKQPEIWRNRNDLRRERRNIVPMGGPCP